MDTDVTDDPPSTTDEEKSTDSTSDQEKKPVDEKPAPIEQEGKAVAKNPLDFILSKMKEPTNERPIDASTIHGQRILEQRQTDKIQRQARTKVFNEFTTPAVHLENWPRIPTMTSRDLYRQQYVAKLTGIMTDAKKLNNAMKDAGIRQLGKSNIIK